MRLYFAPKPTIACETLGIYYRLMLHPSKIESAFRMPILSKSSRTLFFNKFLVFNRAFSLEQLRLKSRCDKRVAQRPGASSEIFNSWNEHIDRL